MRHFLLLTLLGVGLLTAPAAEPDPASYTDVQAFTLDDRPELLAVLETATPDIVLYAGLGRNPPERVPADETLTIAGWRFYKTPQTLDMDDQVAALAVLRKSRSYVPGEAKRCGGFNPNYALRIPTKSGVVYALICLGCGASKSTSTTSSCTATGAPPRSRNGRPSTSATS